MRQAPNALALCAALPATVTGPAASSDVLLPDETGFIQVAADVPENVRKFIGRWEGMWGTELNHIFIVTCGSASGATEATYAHGDVPKWKVKRDWHRVKGTASGDRLALSKFTNSVEVNYTLQGDGSLTKQYWMRRYMTLAYLVG